MSKRPAYRSFPEDYLTNPDRAERAVSEFWKKADVFGEQQRRRAEHAKRFVFYEGPPTANGRPGIHHVFARAAKDAICRYHWMLGERVERKAGWDTHGLPVELEVEKSLGISGKKQIEEEVGVAKFIDLCRESVFKYVKEWRALSERMAYWLDYDHPYVTYEPRYVESVWYLLSRFAAAGLLEKRFKVLPYCPRCGTGLSSHEVGLGYRDVQDPSVTVRFPVVGEPGTSLLVWTTTPWTLPSNVAVAAHPELEYVKVRSPRHPGELFWLAAARAGAVVPDGEVVERKPGSGLLGLRYEAPFPVLDPETEKVPAGVGLFPLTNEKTRNRVHSVYDGAFVTAEDGTGLVHVAPFYGADDYELCLRHRLPLVRAVNADGHFAASIGGVAQGTFFKEADHGLVTDLRERGRLFDRTTVQHSYPFCWRCDTPLLYFASPAWFLRTTAYRDAMVEQNAKTRWVPAEIGTGRFGEWLAGNVDWALSRDRYWGTPLPVWACQQCETHEVIDSLATLRRRVAESKIDPNEDAPASLPDDFDPHRPGIDRVRLRCQRCGALTRREPSVVDCWFDSGAMPFAQHGWPFTEEARRAVEDQFPADYIAEGLDQTRGWFYTLHAIGVFMTSVDEGRTFEGKALPLPRTGTYRACLVNGLVLDAQGRKMSKRLGNAVDPFQAMAQFGADAVRTLLLGSGAIHVNRRFDPDAIAALRRQVILPLSNCLQFFATYANECEAPVGEARKEKGTLLDRWILSRAWTTADEVGRRLDAFDLPGAIGCLADFAEGEVSNWYVRRSRERFRLDPSGDRAAGLAVLRQVLSIAARCLAPIAPFAAEMLWHRIHPAGEEPESVHLQSFPTLEREKHGVSEPVLEDAMNAVLVAARLGRALRERAKIRTTIPLRSLRVLMPRIDPGVRAELGRIQGALAEEVNVDEVQFSAEVGGLAVLKAKPNFPVLGKKVGKRMKEVQAKIEALPAPEVETLRKGGSVSIEAGGERFQIEGGDVRVLAEPLPGLVVESAGEITAALDTAVDEARLQRARAREFKRAVNQARRDAGLALSEICSLVLLESEPARKLAAAIEATGREWLDDLRAREVRTARERGALEWIEGELLDGEIVVFAIGREPGRGAETADRAAGT